MGKFDSIDGAAEAAANLNTVLGLNVNPYGTPEHMSESERIRTLRRS